MKKLIVAFSLFIFSFSSTINARVLTDEKHVVWDKSPILVSMEKGKLMMVEFPSSVSLIKPSLDDIKVRNLKGVLYLTPLTSFEEKELFVKDKSNGEIFLLSLKSSNTPDESYKRLTVESNFSKVSNTTKEEVNKNTLEPINYLSLTRFVIQRLYSQSRLVIPLEGVQRIPMHTKRHVSLLYNNQVIASPIASWRTQHLYVTAVQLHNTFNESIRLDEQRDIKGDWKSAAFYPTNILAKQGDKKDSTLVVLISGKPFNTALTSVYGGDE